MTEQSPLQTQSTYTTSSRVRLDSVRTRLNVLGMFCNMTETDLRWGYVSEAKSLLDKIHHFIAELQRHLQEPNYVPEEELLLLQKRLDEIVQHVGLIEQRTLSSKPGPERGKNGGPRGSGREQ